VVIIEQKPKKYFKRILESYFPPDSFWLHFIIRYVASLSIMFGSFRILFKIQFNLKDWLFFAIMFLLSLYFLIIIPFRMSQIYITKIELDETENILIINYLKYNTKKQIVIGLNKVKYNLFYCNKCTGKIIFYEGVKEILRQYQTSWKLDKMKKVAEKLKNIGIKKPFGYNL